MTSIRMAPRQEVVFHGTEAVLRVTAPFNAALFGEEQLVLERDDKTIEQFRYPGTRQYKLQVENFGRTLRDGSRLSLDAGRRARHPGDDGPGVRGGGRLRADRARMRSRIGLRDPTGRGAAAPRTPCEYFWKNESNGHRPGGPSGAGRWPVAADVA